MPSYALPERVTLAEAAAVLGEALAALHGDGPWRVDAARLGAFDSSCLALLLELRRRAGSPGLRIDAAPQRLRDLAVAYGVEFAIGAE